MPSSESDLVSNPHCEVCPKGKHMNCVHGDGLAPCCCRPRQSDFPPCPYCKWTGSVIPATTDHMSFACTRCDHVWREPSVGTCRCDDCTDEWQRTGVWPTTHNESEFDVCPSYRQQPCQGREDGGCICDVARERDELRALAQSMTLEVERMRPVVEAAVDWHSGLAHPQSTGAELFTAVKAYQEATR